MLKKLSLIVLLSFMVCLISPSVATAKTGEKGKNAEIIFKVVSKLMSKGDEAIISMGRLLKAETYYKKMNKPEEAIKEIELLESEITDSELLFAVNALKMVILKETQKNPETLLASLDKVILAAKKRMGCK